MACFEIEIENASGRRKPLCIFCVLRSRLQIKGQIKIQNGEEPIGEGNDHHRFVAMAKGR
jgi:hypothetical protein